MTCVFGQCLHCPYIALSGLRRDRPTCLSANENPFFMLNLMLVPTNFHLTHSQYIFCDMGQQLNVLLNLARLSQSPLN